MERSSVSVPCPMTHLVIGLFACLFLRASGLDRRLVTDMLKAGCLGAMPWTDPIFARFKPYADCIVHRAELYCGALGVQKEPVHPACELAPWLKHHGSALYESETHMIQETVVCKADASHTRSRRTEERRQLQSQTSWNLTSLNFPERDERYQGLGWEAQRRTPLSRVGPILVCSKW